MKILVPVFIFFASSFYGQTTLIAHKSHSGNESTFALADPGNFGWIEPVYSPNILKIIQLSDTSVIVITDHYDKAKQTDTIYNDPFLSNPDMDFETKKGMLGARIEYINLDQAKEKATDSLIRPAKEEIVPVQESTTPLKEKKKNHLFLLFIIGGGMFTGMMIIFRRSPSSIEYTH